MTAFDVGTLACGPDSNKRDAGIEYAWFLNDLVCPVTKQLLIPVKDNQGKILFLQTLDGACNYPVRGGFAYLLSTENDYFNYLNTIN
jgi:hypothetical protein